ncbi:MAG TPA: crosslink repair DNA glycosylase YcaQ family protein, partial [Mycobacteriales bacterium]|nr:crosslink repair DNA glycosylase YcaQ family protein [Mycobacteriales bacterium]
MPDRLTAARARRIALAAQGFAEPRPAGRVDARHIRRVLRRIGLLQIDSVNVLSRSHYLPVLARLGPYSRDLLDRISWGGRRRELFEFWAHEASLIPLELQPALRWRMQRARDDAWRHVRELAAERPDFIRQVRDLVAERGPIGGGEVQIAGPRPSGGMWNWHDGKIALEWLFYTGEVTTAARPNFERRYDLTERVLPERILTAPTPPVAEAHRELIRVAARALGVATEPDLRDYFRLTVAESKQAVLELVDAGELVPVQVEGWRNPAYLWPEARIPRRIRARALLSPFDSVIWERKRTERLFDFRYRLEIYTPAPKRVFGYYVLPFLLGEE